jgi:hypothetical protein
MILVASPSKLWPEDLGNSLLTCDICCTYCTGVVLDHKGYNMKSAELFRNGQSKPEVLKESKE